MENSVSKELKVYPNPVVRGEVVTVANSGKGRLTLFTLSGTNVIESEVSGNYLLKTDNLIPGVYILRLSGEVNGIAKLIIK